MANWKHSIDIHKEWQACEDGSLPIWELAKVLSAKLKKVEEAENTVMNTFDWELADIREELDAFAEEQISDRNAFDDIIVRVYDWADTALSNRWPPDKMCWIGVM